MSAAQAVRSLSLILTSILLTLALLEGLMRLTMVPADLYDSFPTRPRLNQWHNEVRFWQRYHQAPPADFSSHDPVLGWDSANGGIRVRTSARPSAQSSEALMAIALGDSFVFGNDVGADENFSALLDRHPRLQVLNMGVPGYGIDQSYLKYQHRGSAYAPDIVLFGIYVADYERSTVAFTAFAKPLFVEREADIVLGNQPVPDPLSELQRIDSLLAGRWYLAEFLENLLQRIDTAGKTRFFDGADRVVSHILQTLAGSMGPGQRLIVIHIPSGESFAGIDPVHQEMHRRLLALYEVLDIDHIDLFSAFAADTPALEVVDRYYVRRPSGSVGHLNPAGHRRVAGLIAEKLGL